MQIILFLNKIEAFRFFIQMSNMSAFPPKDVFDDKWRAFLIAGRLSIFIRERIKFFPKVEANEGFHFQNQHHNGYPFRQLWYAG